jgi:YD repeat-containing protein
VIDGEGNRAQLVYEGHDRQTRWIFPSATRPAAYNDATQATALASAGALNGADYEEYTYDLNGNRTSLRKRDGRTIAYSYDALNRLTLKDIAGGTAADVHYGYNARGLQTYARFASTSGQGITSAWNPYGELTSSSTNMGGTTRTLSYQYDANGNRIRITHPDAHYFRTDYDGADRPVTLWANAATAMQGYAYYSHGGVSGTSRPNGTTSQWGYDGLQRLNALMHGLAGTASDAAWTYTRNPASQIASVARDNDAYAWTGHYAVARAYTTNGLNQYIAAGGATFAYDANGNLTSDGASTYSYDVENRLATRSGAVTLPSPTRSGDDAEFPSSSAVQRNFAKRGKLFYIQDKASPLQSEALVPKGLVSCLSRRRS